MIRKFNSQTSDPGIAILSLFKCDLEHLPELWEFNRFDLDDHLRMDGFDKYLQNPQLQRWKQFFNACDSKGKLLIKKGPDQWGAIVASNDVYQVCNGSNPSFFIANGI